MATAIGPALLIVCAAAGAITVWWTLRQRTAALRAQAGPLAQGAINDGVPDTSLQITDGGVVPCAPLLGALCWRSQQDEDFDLEDEGIGNMLKLVYHRHKQLSDTWYEPAVYDGTRQGRQVWIRLGRTSRSTAGVGLDGRRLRTVTAVRCAVAPFELLVRDGRLVLVSGGHTALEQLVARLAPSPDAWTDVRVVGGAEGIVASHGIAHSYLNGWVYDLWLLEHLADRLAAPALDPIELGREWTPPYALGDWAPSLRSVLATVGT